MVDLARDGFTHQQVKDMLHYAAGSRSVNFKYDLLDKDDNFIAKLETVESGSISQSAFSDIKRTAKFTLKEDSYTNEAYAKWSDIGALKWSEL